MEHPFCYSYGCSSFSLPSWEWTSPSLLVPVLPWWSTGIQSVDYGQTEAARSLGMSHRQTMLKIVLPQAIRNILPALGNEFVTIIKETSLLSVFLVGDIMTIRATMGAAYFMPFQALIIAGVIYFVLTFVLSKGIGYIERRMARSD